MMRNNDGGSAKCRRVRKKGGDGDDLYMVVKNNESEPNECVSACLRNERMIEKDELFVYTIFGEMNSIVYIF